MVMAASNLPTKDASNSGLVRQLAATLLISTLTLNGGMIQAWVSPVTVLLKSDNSPVGKMDDKDISYLASFPAYSGLVSSFIYGFIANRYGRKYSVICVGIPSIISGCLSTFATTKFELYLARIFAGFTNIGGISVGPMYVSEIVHDSIRGMTVSSCSFQINVGIMIAYLFGSILSYKAFNTLYIVIPTVYTILLFWLPESPYYLVTKSRMKDANNSLVWLRGGDRRIAKNELDHIQPPKQDEKVNIMQEYKSKAARTATIVTLGLFCLQTLSGIHAVLNYSGLIFTEAGSPLSTGNSSILIASLILGSSFINLFLIDRFGRKPLLFVSFIGGSIGMASLAFYLLAQHAHYNVSNLGWIPITSVSAFVVFYGVGLASVPSVLFNDLTPINIKPLVISVMACSVTVILLIVLQSYPYINEYVGMYFNFGVPMCFNMLGVFFTWLLVPETKGKSLTEISDKLNGVNRISDSA